MSNSYSGEIMAVTRDMESRLESASRPSSVHRFVPARVRALLQQTFGYLPYLLFGLLTLAALINITYGLDNINLIYTFETDEANLVKRVEENLKANDFNPRGHYNYGYVYESLAVVILRFFKAVGYAVDVRFVGTVLRLLCLVGGLLSAMMVVLLSRLLGVGHGISLYAGLFLFMTPSFFYWSQTMHPDTLQTGLICLSIFISFRSVSWSGLVFASLLAGISFGTKYSGIFVLPFLTIPLIFQQISSRPMGAFELVREIAIISLVSTTVFAAAYSISNPYALMNFSAALDDFNYERGHVAIGDGKIEPANPALWIQEISDEYGLLSAALFACGFAAAILSMIVEACSLGFRRWVASETTRHKLILLLYCILAGAYLFFAVRMRVFRFTFHVLPFFVVLSAIGVERSLSKIPKVINLIVSLLLVTTLLMQTQRAFSATSYASAKPLSPIMISARFLQENFPRSVKILADFYCYIPPEFNQVRNVWGVNRHEIDVYAPDILILTVGTTGRWAWMKGNSKFAEAIFDVNESYGQQADDTHDFLSWLASRDSGWRVAFEDENVVIFSRQTGEIHAAIEHAQSNETGIPKEG